MAENEERGILLAPGEGPSVDNPVRGRLTFKVRGEQSNGALSAFESDAPPAEGPPLHVHPNADEIWYVLEGTFRVRLDDAIEDAPSGTFVFIPRGVPHTWQNVGAAPGRFLAILTPAGLERFFDRFAEQADDIPGRDPFRAFGREYGMEAVGPPLSASNPV
jgi:mannose-6-phosphate isomerase-like protein (cupin superfamily)